MYFYFDNRNIVLIILIKLSIRLYNYKCLIYHKFSCHEN